MRIGQNDYKIDLTDIQNIRYLLFTNLYGNIVYINSLKEIISRYIDCLSIDFDSSSYKFTIKIKKTSMRKNSGFENDPNYYYRILPNIFYDFIQSNKEMICQIFDHNMDNGEEIINSLCNQTYCLSNLCQVTCMGDNIVNIKL